MGTTDFNDFIDALGNMADAATALSTEASRAHAAMVNAETAQVERAADLGAAAFKDAGADEPRNEWAAYNRIMKHLRLAKALADGESNDDLVAAIKAARKQAGHARRVCDRAA